jgi:hypothetical protein
MTLFNFCRGEDFRPKFKHLGDLTCIFPNAAHLAVTATATPKSIHVLGVETGVVGRALKFGPWNSGA